MRNSDGYIMLDIYNATDLTQYVSITSPVPITIKNNYSMFAPVAIFPGLSGNAYKSTLYSCIASVGNTALTVANYNTF